MPEVEAVILLLRQVESRIEQLERALATNDIRLRDIQTPMFELMERTNQI